MKKHFKKKYALVDFRHSFTTRSLKNGVDSVTLSFLLGHADTSMLARQYAHLDQEVGHLRDALGKANVVKPASASALQPGERAAAVLPFCRPPPERPGTLAAALPKL